MKLKDIGTQQTPYSFIIIWMRAYTVLPASVDFFILCLYRYHAGVREHTVIF